MQLSHGVCLLSVSNRGLAGYSSQIDWDASAFSLNAHANFNLYIRAASSFPLAKMKNFLPKLITSKQDLVLVHDASTELSFPQDSSFSLKMKR